MELLIELNSSDGASVDKVERKKGKVIYNGESFDGFNKPKKNTGSGKHKMLVLAKKGDRVKLIKFGNKDYEDYTQHKDKKRRASYHARHKAIKTSEGKPAWKDKFQAAHWALKVLW